MNIYFFELKRQIKSAVIWTVAIAATLLIFQSTVYKIFSNSLEDIEKMLAGYPKEFVMAFGFDSMTMSGFGNFFSLTYMYISLMGAIMASAISISSFSREKRGKCLDFILTKPRGRFAVFAEKLLSVVTSVTVSNLIIILTAAAVYRNTDTENYGKFILSLGGLFFTELFFVAAGALFSEFARKIHSVSGTATAFGFGSFILSALCGIMNDEKMRYITPLKYFDPSDVYAGGCFEMKYVIAAAVIAAVCVGAACLNFVRRDTRAA